VDCCATVATGQSLGLNIHPAMNTQDIIPVFDKRDGADCAHLQLQTWSDMGLPWNRYCDYSRSFSRMDVGETPETMLAKLVQDLRAHGKRIIAASLHNYAVSVAVVP
jgi:hypothetical protein